MVVTDVKVRFAQPGDEALLHALVDTGPWKVQWQGCTNGWLIAQTEKGEVLGAVCIYLGHPVGRVELLSLRDGMGPRAKHATALALARVAIGALLSDGSQIVTAHCAFKDKGFKRLIKKHFGASVTNSGNMLAIFAGA